MHSGIGTWMARIRSGNWQQSITEIAAMSNAKRQTWWQRRHSLTAGEAALLSIAIGSAAAIVSALTHLPDFTPSFLVLLLLTSGPCGGIAGYMRWCAFEEVRGERRRWLPTIMALPLIVWLLVAFPNIWWREAGRSTGPFIMYSFLCFIFTLVAASVAAVMGIADLVGHVAFSLRCYSKPGAVPQMDGVWDRELDQNCGSI